MARRSWLDLVWPVGGVDRSLTYQKQPPFTSPDALNVRTEDMAEHRERGGSRPGLAPVVRNPTDGPVRLLTKISVLKADWPWNHVPAYGNELPQKPPPAWADPPTYTPGVASNQGVGGYLSGDLWAVGFGTPVERDTSKTYEVACHIRAATGKPMVGEVAIYMGLPNLVVDPFQSCIECKLIFTATDWRLEVKRYAAGLVTQTFNSAVFTTDLGLPGTFLVEIDPIVAGLSFFWRRQSLGSMLTAPTLLGHESAVEVTGADLQVTKLSMSYEWLATSVKSYRSQRRDLLVAISEGDLWLEYSPNRLNKRVSNGLSTSGEMTAVDYQQKLYIADYGAAISGTASGTIAAATFNTLKDPAKNFNALGITTSYMLELIDSDYTQNEKQLVSLFNADAGNYRLSFRGAFTSPIPQATQGNGVKALLEALPTIGVGNVNVVGAAGGPHTVEFIGTLAAQDLELMGSLNIDLTHTSGATSVVEVTSAQNGAGGDYVRGSYQISGVAGDTLTFVPPIVVAPGFISNIGSVTYNVVRSAKVFDPKTGVLSPYVASKGFAPAGCRIICLYRDRILLAANDLAPHVWYASRQGDPYDWDYSQEDSGAAIFAQASIGGILADPITAMIAHGDECVIVGCYNSLWIIRGDPGYGGTQDQLSRKIGIVGPHAWCRTPDDMCVFLAPDGLYVMAAGCHGFPTSLSRERLPADLLGATQEKYAVSLEFDTIHRGIHIFLTPYDSSQGIHWWFDWEAKSFWRVSLQSIHEPFTLHERVAWDDTPSVLLGCRDGYIREFNRDHEQDDGGHTINSYCLLGPFHLDREGYMEGILTNLHGTLGLESGPVNWEVLAGNSAQAAVRAISRENGSWLLNGLNYLARPRVRGVAACIKVSNGSPNRRWFMERLTAAVKSAGYRRVR